MPTPNQVMLFPRPGRPGFESRKPIVSFAPVAFFPFHHVNAYEEEEVLLGPDGRPTSKGEGASGSRVVIDTVGWDEVDFEMERFITEPEYYEGGCRPHLMRLVVTSSPAGTPADASKLLGNRTIEFPSVSPTVTGLRHCHLYCTADTVGHDHLWGPAQALMKVTLPVPKKGDSACCPGEPNGSGRVGMGLNNIIPSNVSPTVGVSSSEAAVRWSARLPVQGMMMDVPCTSSSSESSILSIEAPILDLWEPGPRSFCGEPMLVPKPGGTREDDAWIIVGVHNAETLKADILIFDAARCSIAIGC